MIKALLSFAMTSMLLSSAWAANCTIVLDQHGLNSVSHCKLGRHLHVIANRDKTTITIRQ